MCGIYGAAALADHRSVGETARAMAPLLQHRGPDAFGDWEAPGVFLGHRRLSIIDLSDAARQPLANEDATIWVSCNGEIYNYRELGRWLAGRGHTFRSASDSESIVHLYEEFGLEFVSHLQGMFAIALWDVRRRRLVLARDRLGKKPLVYTTSGGVLYFASEIRALLAIPELDRSICLGAVRRFLALQYVPAPESIFAGVRKLQPGTLLIMEESGQWNRRH